MNPQPALFPFRFGIAAKQRIGIAITIAAMVALILTLLTLLVSSVSAAPNAIVVNSALDPGDGVCNAQNCTLREAITLANGTVGVKETIKFNIPTASAGCSSFLEYCIIALNTGLPAITDPVVINGYSQPGAHPNTLAVGNDAALKIILDGQVKDINGLMLLAGDSAVKGLAIQNFSVVNRAGIYIQSDGNTVQGNFIGTNLVGTNEIGNYEGVSIFWSDSNLIGGNTPAARNLISGNGVGIYIYNNADNLVQGNYIGTNYAGKVAIPNSFGIRITLGGSHTIGGGTGTRNVIAGNVQFGIKLEGSSNNEIRGNDIGIGTDQNDLGNAKAGIQIENNSQNNLVTKNKLVYNKIGIVLTGNNSTQGNTISDNAIYGNDELGIDLAPLGQVNPNDALDSDKGPNHRQNYPKLTTVSVANGATTIKGTLKSEPNKSYTIEFFVNEPCDGGGYGEGAKYWGSKTVITDGNGVAKFTFAKNKTLAGGAGVSATATELMNGNPTNTSEFSNCQLPQ